MKILVSDFDGTFFDDNYIKNIEIINNFVDDGNIFIIATGRSINNLKQDINDYNIKYSYLICSDGASIYDSKHNNLYTCNIEKELINPICNRLDNDSNIVLTLIENDNFVSSTIANSIAGKFIDKKLAFELLENLKQEFPQIYGYLSENYINIRNNKVSKANAIDFLIDYCNLKKEEVFTVGDSVNDLEMLERFNSFTFYHVNQNVKNVSKNLVLNFEEVIDKIKSSKY